MQLILFCAGESAVRNIINQGRRAAASASDPEKSRIEKVCNELDKLLDDLAALRRQGKVWLFVFILVELLENMFFAASKKVK